MPDPTPERDREWRGEWLREPAPKMERLVCGEWEPRPRGLGIIPQLELDCMLRPGELGVCWTSTTERALGASETLGGAVCDAGPWECFDLRYCGPWAPREPRSFHTHEIVVRVLPNPWWWGAAPLIFARHEAAKLAREDRLARYERLYESWPIAHVPWVGYDIDRPIDFDNEETT